MSKKLHQFWEQGIQKFEALNAREKKMVLGAVLCVFYGLYSFLIEPTQLQIGKLNQQIQANAAEQHSLELQLNVLTNKKLHPVESQEALKIKALNQNITQLNSKVDQLKSALINPNNVPDLLSDLIDKDPQLKLIALETLVPTGLFSEDGQDHANHSHAQAVFKHGVEMTVEGRYLDLMRYIAKLENLPWHILWEKAVIEVEEEPESAFPLSQLTLVVYSLSLDKAWLAI